MSTTRKIHLRLEYDGRVLHEIDASEISSELTVGRADDNAWVLPEQDKSAHRHHALLRRRRNGDVLVVACDRRKGQGRLFYLGKEVQEHLLRGGDIVSIGDSKLVAEEAATAAIRSGSLPCHQLEQLSGEQKGRTYRIEKGVFRIGSAPECECCIQDSLVSKLHAVIEVQLDGSCRIKDNHSRNGTAVNGVPLREEHAKVGRMLKDGDVVTVAYVELKFWDKNVVHVRSHLLLKLCAVVATLALALGGYFACQSVMPNAQTLLKRAEAFAKAGDFASAEQLLAQAREARGAELEVKQLGKLEENLVLWKDTTKTWQDVKSMLNEALKDKRAFYDLCVNDDFISKCKKLAEPPNDKWSWSPSAGSRARVNVEALAGLLSSNQGAKQALSASWSEKDLRKWLNKLEAAINACPRDDTSEDFLPAVREIAENTQEGIKEVLYLCDSVSKTMEDYRSLEDTDKVIRELKEILARAEKEKELREAQGWPASGLGVDRCRDYLEPMERIRECNSLLQESYEALAQCDFEVFYTKISAADDAIPRELPSEVETVKKCLESEIALLSDLVKDLEIKVRNVVAFFKDDNSKKLLEHLFAPATTEAVLRCDCLEFCMRDELSEYGRVLGCKEFYGFLTKPADGVQVPPDVSDEEKWPQELYQVSRLIKNRPEDFVKYWGNSKNEDMKEKLLGVLPKENRLVELKAEAEEILKRRDIYLRELYGIFQDEHDTRRGILAGGIVCCLMTDQFSTADIPLDREQLYMEVGKAIANLRKELNRQESDGSRTPEEAQAFDDEYYLRAIPGDTKLTRIWNEKHPLEP
ncbi:MAG: FHA domain-containing protein [Victivallales bacterium]|nr:FHA domain-containing protein [Victivallales bacterium]MBQ6472389.1 FHA domain-containing protein [Victivallales bacterium]